MDISKPTENPAICHDRQNITDVTTTQSATHSSNIYLKVQLNPGKMAAPAGLPDPDTLDAFAYDDITRNEMVDIVSADNTHPRIIEDYVLDPVDCKYYLDLYCTALAAVLFLSLDIHNC